MQSADNFTFVKMAASEIAHKHGMIATFMPKPFSNRTGSGAHFHVSVGSKTQKNAFHDPKDKSGMGLSKMAYHFLGGILAHARAFSAIAAPTVNSYKRLVVGRSLSGATWAPAYIAYGDNNRSACVRIPYGRLEVRLPDSGCNAYLVTAAMIAAGLDGIDRKLELSGLKIALGMGVVAALLQLASGHETAQTTARNQPAKLAAMASAGSTNP